MFVSLFKAFFPLGALSSPCTAIFLGGFVRVREAKLSFRNVISSYWSWCMYFFLFISTRGSGSLQVLILQFNSRLLLLGLLVCLVLSCLVLSFRLSRVFASWLLCNYCRYSAAILQCRYSF